MEKFKPVASYLAAFIVVGLVALFPEVKPIACGVAGAMTLLQNG